MSKIHVILVVRLQFSLIHNTESVSFLNRLSFRLPINRDYSEWEENQNRCRSEKDWITIILSFQFNSIKQKSHENYFKLKFYRIMFGTIMWKQNWNWNHRKHRNRGAEKTITRLYTVNSKQPALFHLQLLLLRVHGPPCFEYILAHCVRISYRSWTCYWRIHYNEWRDINRELIICKLCVPTNAAEIWDASKSDMYEYFTYQYDPEVSYDQGLLGSEDILITNNTSCKELGWLRYCSSDMMGRELMRIREGGGHNTLSSNCIYHRTFIVMSWTYFRVR